MNELTVQNMIFVLPFDQQYREALLHKLSTLDQEHLASVEAIIKELYEGVFSLHYEQNLQNAIKAAPPEAVIDDAFYKTIQEQTRLEFVQKISSPDATQLNLIGTRDKLQQVVSEKQTVTSNN